ncbi:MAG: YifB family Mg chelatase-like AAA ATPase [Myxococcales bacterium]
MLATVHSASLSGIESIAVEVQAFFGKGLPGVDIVGLGDTAVRESRVRVRSALESSGLELPSRHVVLNLAPADVRKSGSGLDLAIALALLCAGGVAAPSFLPELVVLGELALGGELRAVRGVLSHLRAAEARGFRRAIVPVANVAEAQLVPGLDVRCAASLRDVVIHLRGDLELPRALTPTACLPRSSSLDLSDVRGQYAAKRALEVAAAGNHNLLLVGPPGTGKSMLAQRLPTLLPRPSQEEAIEIATIASATGSPTPARLSEVERPFRAPHHSLSAAALVGGGNPIQPGEVTLAHGGVLFLDELPEFSRSSLECLRPTMESGRALVARTHERVELPARPLVVCAMNPCPCGYADDPRRLCMCPPDRVERYRTRISGPLLDRFDMHVALKPVEARILREGLAGDDSVTVRSRVEASRAWARERAELGSGASLAGPAADTDEDALRLLDRAVDALGLSARGYTKVLRVSRTIADLERAPRVGAQHVAEAIQYRLLDRSRVERGLATASG